MATEVIAKKWGNSIGFILPKDVAEKQGIKENDKLVIDIIRPFDFSNEFGSLKGKLKMTGQEFKDMVRDLSE